MCDPLTLAMTGAQVFGQLQAGKAAQSAANVQAAGLDFQAELERQRGVRMAETIRRAGRRQVGQTVAAYAGAGVVVGEGSAGDVERQVRQDVEHDAFQAILDGDLRGDEASTQARLARIAGRSARQAATWDALSTALGSGYRGMRASGYGSAGPGWAGTQAPAPVETRTIPRG
jgi:hypothetical protein